MKFNEPRNADIFFNMARLFARYCGRREAILEKTLKMLDEAVTILPENSDYYSEIASQKCMLGDYTGSYQVYSQAQQYDQTNQIPLYGMIQCKIKQDQVEDAEQQLEFLLSISENGQKTSDHAYLEAIITWR
mmetsp:Transcript_13183/g.20529  ORF Transcript_13183/g.20529 Transcript_13183/m.20529 type:complete len:132 (+) Transcript_13183:853-1248(+)